MEGVFVSARRERKRECDTSPATTTVSTFHLSPVKSVRACVLWCGRSRTRVRVVRAGRASVANSGQLHQEGSLVLGHARALRESTMQRRVPRMQWRAKCVCEKDTRRVWGERVVSRREHQDGHLLGHLLDSDAV